MSQSFNDSPLERVLALGDATRVGQYRVDLATEQWWWSDETFRIHGFEPGEVVPTTAMVLAHKHPEDRDRVRHVLDDARRDGEPFATVHRIVDANGSDHVVSIVGQGQRDGDGQVVALVGYVLDLSSSVKRYAAQQADDSIRAAAQSRSTIEQAKGIIRLALNIGGDEAFEVLRHYSNVTNVRVRELAAALVEQAQGTSEPHERLAPLLDALQDATHRVRNHSVTGPRRQQHELPAS
ncbi:PAS domain-containing protein [Isoptericola sp. NEAU-Y5]|uniref:histidine kinase n=1 Tax=Isoptericola luteus TaxID=2879484 RepID=A0ABS7ZG49_9MICO|nr:PAS and ANTAR domain-containing protein [Isoptericola sp. NEAU-Y5]MCA5893996.1 PAS domain-containing protein [Isoptericola sp. NEAU-Y5]